MEPRLFKRCRSESTIITIPLQLLQAEEYHDSQLFENIQNNMMQGKDICLTVTIDKTADGKYPDTCISELHFVAGMN